MVLALAVSAVPARVVPRLRQDAPTPLVAMAWIPVLKRVLNSAAMTAGLRPQKLGLPSLQESRQWPVIHSMRSKRSPASSLLCDYAAA